MKLQLIETPDYILAISDKIEEGINPEVVHFDNKIDRNNIHKTTEFYTGEIMFLYVSGISDNYRIIRKIIAHLPKNNSHELDLPLLPQIIVEDNVEKLPYDKLCYYDTRSSDFQIKEEYGYDKEEVDATGEFPKKDCACDNCFYGRAKLADRIIKAATKVYSEEDLINFGEWISEIDTLNYELPDGSLAGGDFKLLFKDYIQSLKQSKTPKWFVAEKEYLSNSGEWKSVLLPSEWGYYTQFRFKTSTINNTTYLMGKYE
jgi:hypothetical protein